MTYGVMWHSVAINNNSSNTKDFWSYMTKTYLQTKCSMNQSVSRSANWSFISGLHLSFLLSIQHAHFVLLLCPWFHPGAVYAQAGSGWFSSKKHCVSSIVATGRFLPGARFCSFLLYGDGENGSGRDHLWVLGQWDWFQRASSRVRLRVYHPQYSWLCFLCHVPLLRSPFMTLVALLNSAATKQSFAW